MAVSGVLILAYGAITQGVRPMETLWKTRDWRALIVFALVGLLGVQYSYLAAIQSGNAASATLLQYLGPSLVTLWVAVKTRQWPRRRQIVAVTCTLFGTWLVVSNGHFALLSVPSLAVFWGLLSAVTLAFYSLFPSPLLKRWGAVSVVGWGMLVGSLAAGLRWTPWHIVQWPHSLLAWTLLGFVVVGGTTVAFLLYLMSLSRLSASTASVLTSAEPLVATVAAMVWLHVDLHPLQDVGAAMIIAGVIILALRPETHIE
jgi:drug/metabolite transporter (DMT)-like permease